MDSTSEDQTSKPGKNRRKALIIGGGTFGVITILAVIGAMNPTPTPPAAGSAAPQAVAADAPAPAPAQKATPTGAINRDGIEVAIKSVRITDSVGPEYARVRAADGAVLVKVSYGLKNVSGRPIEGLSLPGVHLIDPNGVSYDQSDNKTIVAKEEHPADLQMLPDDLNPGVTLHETAVFEVSAATFDPATWTVKVGDAGDALPLHLAREEIAAARRLYHLP